MIEFEHVSLSLGAFSLKEISLRVKEGDYYFILGPSGAGKTILLEAIAGLHRPESGRVMVRGEDVGATPPEKRRVSLVYQDYSLFPHMTVYQNVAFGLKMQKMPKPEIRKEVDAILERFGISHLRDRHPLTMSGGEQQRVALARSLVVKPEILLLDEPLSALDPLTRERFICDLRKLHEEQHLTIVQVSHSREEALALAGHIAVIIDGHLEQEGTAEDVFHRPVNPPVARFVGVENILHGRVVTNDNDLLGVDIGGLTVSCVGEIAVGEEADLYFRGSEITLAPPETAAGSARNTFSGTVVDIFPMIPLVRVRIACNGVAIYAVITSRSATDMGLVVGSEVSVIFKASSVHTTACGSDL